MWEITKLTCTYTLILTEQFEFWICFENTSMNCHPRDPHKPKSQKWGKRSWSTYGRQQPPRESKTIDKRQKIGGKKNVRSSLRQRRWERERGHEAVVAVVWACCGFVTVMSPNASLTRWPNDLLSFLCRSHALRFNLYSTVRQPEPLLSLRQWHSFLRHT